MGYRNILFDEDDLEFIKNNKHLTGRTLQEFVSKAIKKEIKDIQDIAELLKKRRAKQFEEKLAHQKSLENNKNT